MLSKGLKSPLVYSKVTVINILFHYGLPWHIPVLYNRTLLFIQRADILAHSPFGQNRIKRLEELNAISEELKASGAVFNIRDLDIDGNDIIALGVKPGPDVGMIMSRVFDSYIEERCYNNKNSLINEAKKIISGTVNLTFN